MDRRLTPKVTSNPNSIPRITCLSPTIFIINRKAEKRTPRAVYYARIAHNVIAKNPDEAAVRQQEHVPLAIDMAPVQPHTAQRKARTCGSCHAILKTAGLGLGGGTFGTKQYMDIVEDLIDAKTGEVIPQKYSVQIPGIPNWITGDFSIFKYYRLEFRDSILYS